MHFVLLTDTSTDIQQPQHSALSKDQLSTLHSTSSSGKPCPVLPLLSSAHSEQMIEGENQSALTEILQDTNFNEWTDGDFDECTGPMKEEVIDVYDIEFDDWTGFTQRK